MALNVPRKHQALTPESIDLEDRAIVFRTHKQRNQVRYRAVPLPAVGTLELVRAIRKAKRGAAICVWCKSCLVTPRLKPP